MSKKENYLMSKDLLPVKHSDKKIGSLGFAFIWVGMAVLLATFAIGGNGVEQLSLPWVVLATIIGSIAIGTFMTLIGDIGIEHGLSFPVYMRAPFGTIGTHIPSLIRGLAASCWFGINTYFGASAINGILSVLTDYDNWFACFIIFASFQVINTSLGIKAVERFANLAAPIIIIISAWMYTTLSDKALEQGREVWAWVESPVTGSAAVTAFIIVIMANMGFWATLAADMPSISRFIKAPQYERNWFKRNKASLTGNLFALTVTQTFMVIIGGVSYIAVKNYDPVIALQEAASGIILGVLLLMIVLAQWSTNVSANLIPAATIFSNIGGPKTPFWVGVVMAGVIGILVQPWELFDIIMPALLVVGGILSAIVGILFADYYLLRKRQVNVPDLYRHQGQYHYLKGFNVAGLVAWVLGGVTSYALSSYSFVVGFSVGAVSYYILAKYWWFVKYKQAEIEQPNEQRYLGITVGRDWIIDDEHNVEKPLQSPSHEHKQANASF
ncbi:NCS1 family transporter [Longirhabdus pacifica]|uniref:NCS1 family transporter n=1 Tax=Longirhabdus pacifica TaxID=2305227 RepID=UPI001008828C|nr:NCS1 family transporter [Longirhabdus pacifica]